MVDSSPPTQVDPALPPTRLADPIGFLLRGLGLVYLIAFGSLWGQLDGLFGTDGILPSASQLEQLSARFGAEAPLRFPTLGWLAAGDLALHVYCALGLVAAALLMLGVVPGPALIVAWLLYLSLFQMGRPFLSFQWDILLLEASAAALFVVPFRRWLPFRTSRDPFFFGVLLLRVLLFKLMFLSGAVKLLSMDDTWWKLTALDYHYFTQPLPTWTAWYAHHLPPMMQRLSVFGMFIIELVVPFGLFGPRRVREFAFVALLALQLGIAVTGNYTFFNLLTAVLCLAALDRQSLGRRLPFGRVVISAGARPLSRPAQMRRALATLLALLFLGLHFAASIRELDRTRPRGGSVDWVDAAIDRTDFVLRYGGSAALDWTDRLALVNGYGLFRRMTTTRPEIVIEGSHNGRDWLEYGFPHKPGALDRKPRFVAPHQPRLDWQMWFAALNPRGASYWLNPLLQHLLRGTPEVVALLETNPFEAQPPRYVRLQLYEYEFSQPTEKRQSGNWWKRTPRGTGRTLSLENAPGR